MENWWEDLTEECRLMNLESWQAKVRGYFTVIPRELAEKLKINNFVVGQDLGGVAFVVGCFGVYWGGFKGSQISRAKDVY